LIQLLRQPGGEQLLVDGRAPRPGERFRNPGMARTLRGVAEGGRGYFYEGDPARAIVAAVQGAGGVLSEEDLARHTSTWDEPLCAAYRDLRVWECPPNGQGLAALLALNLVEGFDLASLDPLGPDRQHLLIEAMRLALADARAFVADPAFSDVPVEALLAREYADARRAQIDPRRANPDALAGQPLGGSDTVYLCVVDGAGNACSFINSNYWMFGTGIVPEGCGFPLQNRGSGFSLDPAHPNALAPGKRPLHTILPGLLTREADGSLFGPFGVMGGAMQPQGHLQVASALADDGLDPQRALDRPRFFIRGGTPDGEVSVEEGMPEATLAELEARGHVLKTVSGYGRIAFGKGQVIRRDPGGVLWGGSDPRADGCAMALS
jgi:gamma-glutamyltranspeptidase/glutathione hydrolase